MSSVTATLHIINVGVVFSFQGFKFVIRNGMCHGVQTDESMKQMCLPGNIANLFLMREKIHVLRSETLRSVLYVKAKLYN